MSPINICIFKNKQNLPPFVLHIYIYIYARGLVPNLGGTAQHNYTQSLHILTKFWFKYVGRQNI
jgi:hypothetical protein